MKLWTICLALYLIVVGLLSLTNITFVFAGAITGLLALLAGVLLLFDR